MMRESKYSELINASTNWNVLNTAQRKAIGYLVPKKYYVLQIGEWIELFWRKREASDAHEGVLHTDYMFYPIKGEHDKAEHIKARILMHKMVSDVRKI